jgi:hypothetical protein
VTVSLVQANTRARVDPGSEPGGYDDLAEEQHQPIYAVARRVRPPANGVTQVAGCVCIFFI